MIKPGLGAVGVVFDGCSAVAAAVLLELNGTVLYKYGASDPAALKLRPNDYLFDQAIRQAFQQGFHSFDFGVTAESEAGLRRFKKKWGSSETTVSCFAVSGPIPSFVRDSRFARLASTIIRRSPTFVCRALGESLYKYSQ
jgi:CelD/BcsL family acetyltransferase involved in cellulose biosynthesis